MSRDPDETRWTARRTLVAFAAIAVPVNLVLGAVLVRLSIVDDLSPGQLREAARDVLRFLLEFPSLCLDGSGEAIVVLIVAAAFLASQVLFLVPWVDPRPSWGSSSGWPLGVSAASAGLVGAALSVALAYGLGEALAQVLITGLPRAVWGNQAVDLLDRGPFSRIGPVSPEWLLIAPLFGLVPLWILSGVLLARVTTDADPRRPDVQLRRLLAGSVASIVLMIPFDALARKRGACICTTGTWISLCIGFLALLWLAGPAVVLLLNRRRRLAWRREACLACGYPRQGRSGTRCSECGTPDPAGE